MRELNEQWVEEIDGKMHMLKAVDPFELCQGCCFNCNQGGTDDIENLLPAQRIVNHYKRCLDNETFKKWLLGGLHERLKKLPKNPYTEKGKRHKAYMLEVARTHRGA